MNRRQHGVLIPAIVLIIIGLVGMLIAMAVLAMSDSGPFGASGFRRGATAGSLDADGGTGEAIGDNGERIYFTGSGRAGPIRIEWDPGRRSAMMGRRPGRGFARMGCADCHGPDGLGTSTGLMFSARTPDIRYRVLTADPDTSGKGWSDTDIATAIREGVTRDGETLDPMMPRWEMDPADMRDTIEFLKTLD